MCKSSSVAMPNRHSSTLIPCSLCGCKKTAAYHEDPLRTYLQCSHCMLVFVPSQYWLSSKQEKAEYDLHQNSAEDQGYRHFLSRLSTPLLKRLTQKKYGLDFGCGPGPALSVVLEEHGKQVDLYDPFYFNDSTILHKCYDFICATEVVEHLQNPGKTFDQLFSMIYPDGWLALMTKLVKDRTAFSQWHYTRDLTHVCFYSAETFEYISRQYHASIEIINNDVILINKK